MKVFDIEMYFLLSPERHLKLCNKPLAWLQDFDLGHLSVLCHWPLLHADSGLAELSGG